MNVRFTLKQLGDLAVNEIGFCVGIHWRSVTGSCVPPGMISPNCRLVYVLFSGFAPAYRFHDLLARLRATGCLATRSASFVSSIAGRRSSASRLLRS